MRKYLIITLLLLLSFQVHGQKITSTDQIQVSQFGRLKKLTVKPTAPVATFGIWYNLNDSLHFENPVKDWNLGKMASVDTLAHYVMTADSTVIFVTPSQLYDTLGYYYMKVESDSLFEFKLPDEPENPETKYLNGLKQWTPIAIGAGGFAGNVYFTNLDSGVSGYKQISYINDVTEVVLTGTITNQEALFRTYLYDSPIETTVIDAGIWVANYRVKVSNAVQTTQLKMEVFLRHTDNSETTLWSDYSADINNTDYTTIRSESNQPSFTCASTDRLGVRIYGKTTSPTAVTISTIIGDGDASYFTTPLQIRHNQLRDLSWPLAGHFGPDSTLAGFDNTGLPVTYPETNYLLRDGTRPLTGDWAAGAFKISNTDTIQGVVVNPTGLTTGYLPYKSANGLASSGMYWDAVNSRFGNTATLSDILHITSPTTNGRGILLDSGSGNFATLRYASNGSVKSMTGTPTKINDIVYGSVVGDFVFRTISGKTLFSQDNGTTINMSIATTGINVTGTGAFTTSVTAPTAKFTTGATNGYIWSCTNADGSGQWIPFTGAVYKGKLDGDDGKPEGSSTPLIDGTGTTGWYYACYDAGTYDYGNPSGNSITLAVGDQLYYNGTKWMQVPGAGTYTLPTATASVLGGIKVGNSLAIASEILDIKDGDKGDIDVSSTGTVFTIDTAAVTYNKIQNVSAQWKVLGRKSASAGVVEEFSMSGTGNLLGDISPTVTDSLRVANVAYGNSWIGSTGVPTKGALVPLFAKINDSIAKGTGHYYTLRDSVRVNITNIGKLQDSITAHRTAIGSKLDTTLATGVLRSQWSTAYTDRLKWDGGATGLVPATGLTSLGLAAGGKLLPVGTVGRLLFHDGTSWTPSTNSYYNNSTGALSLGMTTAPSSILQINGDLTMGTGTGDKKIQFNTSSAWYYYLASSSNDFRIYDYQGTDYFKAFYNGGGTGKYASILSALNVYNSGAVTTSSTLKIGSIPHSTTDIDRFLKDSAGIVKYRTGAEVLSDIGAQAAITAQNVTTGSNKITLGGTPTGATLQPFSIDVDQTKIDHNSLLNYDARKHYYKQSIDSLSTGLTTGLVKVTAGKLSTRPDSTLFWNQAYNYSQIGHLPLTGGTLTGDVTLSGGASLLFGTEGETQTQIYWNGTTTMYKSLGYHSFYDFTSHKQFEINATGVNIITGKTYQIADKSIVSDSTFNPDWNGNHAYTASKDAIYDRLKIVSDTANTALTYGANNATSISKINDSIPALRTAINAKLDTTKATYTNRYQWGLGYTDRLKWDGGSTGLVAATGRTSLGLGTAAVANLGTGATDAAYGNHLHTGTYVPSGRNITINGTTYDLSADRSWTVSGMVYPGAGVPVSTGSGWGTSFSDQHVNWNDAYDNKITSATFNALTGNLALTQQDAGSVSVNLDGRYLTTGTNIPLFPGVVNDQTMANQTSKTYRKGESEYATITGYNNPHSSLIVGDYYYVLTRTNPATLFRFDINNFASYTSCTFTSEGYHGSPDQMIYVAAKSKIYIAFANYGRLVITQVGTGAVNDTTTVLQYSSPAMRLGVPMVTDGSTYLYVTSNASAGYNYADSLYQYRMSDWVQTSKIQIMAAGTDYPHAMTYDGSKLYITTTGTSATSATNRIIQVSTPTMAVGLSLYTYSYMTDDIVTLGDKLYIGKEDATGYILVVDKSTNPMTKDSIYTGIANSCYGVFYDGSQIWATMNGTPGGLAKIDPYTGDAAYMLYPSGYNATNELNFEGGRFFTTFYSTNFKIARIGLPKLMPVRGEDKIYSTTVTLSAAEIQSLYSSPKIAVPAPGIGKAIKVMSAEVFLDYLGSAYASYDDLRLFTTTLGDQYLCINVLSESSDHFRSFDNNYSVTSTTIVENSALLIGTLAGNPTGGTSTAKVYITYKIITL